MQEEWKDVVGYEEYFKVSNLGKVFSKRTNKILKQYTRKNRRVSISTQIGGRTGKLKCFRVHRLVAEAFLPNPDNKATVNHIDGDPSNNQLVNLEWATNAENMRHARDSNLYPPALKSFNNPLSKLTESDVLEIKESYISHHRYFGCRALAKKYNVHHTQISRVIRLR